MSETEEALIVDVRGLQCPLPVLKTAKRMKPLPPGAAVVVLTTDPMAAIDVPHFCREEGHRLVSAEKQDCGEMRFEIVKAGAARGARR
jgi:tRNA 2-thiouridine synthesizing protein A